MVLSYNQPLRNPNMKHSIVLLLCIALFGCTTAQLSTFDADAVTALSAINSLTGAAIASGALPSGKASDIVNDANTISAALETIATGAPITKDQAVAVATSFKSNSSTTSYAALVPLIVNPIVQLVQAKIAAGATTAEVQTAQVQAIANAPTAVQAAVSTATATTP